MNQILPRLASSQVAGYFGNCLNATAAALVLMLAVKARSAPSLTNAIWESSNHFRFLLSVECGQRKRSNSPGSVEVDFQQALATQRVSGTFDENTLEVVPVDLSADQPGKRRNAATKPVPYRLDKYFGSSMVTLHFVIPDEVHTNYAVYFDTIESHLAKPTRYHGLIGDGDRFCERYSRREIAASHFDCFCDFDGDGDLDLFKGGVEPFVYCFENVGQNRFVDRGRLTSGGKLFRLPCSNSNRSWLTVAFYDIDGDGDQDFFPSFGDGPDAGQIIFFKNVTRESGGQLTFKRIGALQTASGVPLAGGAQAGGWFPSITFVKDWDGRGNGRIDALVGSNNRCWRYRGLGTNADGSPQFADAVAVQAGGADIVLTNPRFDCADIDGDGDLDLFAGTQPGPILWFENIGTRAKPDLAPSKVVAFNGKYLIGDAHSSVKVADFDGDGLVDFVAGRFWERTDLKRIDEPREFGGFHKNVGSRASPRFERRSRGGPFTEQFQICDAVRQNSVRAVDWDNDGQPDLLAGDTDGFTWFFCNEGDRSFPIFAPATKLRAGNEPLTLAGKGGHARFDIGDWNNDGKKDLITADGQGTITLFLNQGNKSAPALAEGQPVIAGAKPIQIKSRASVLICDWDNDGRKDLILADERSYYFCKNIGTDANPALAAPAAITFNGKPPGYVRPNLGSLVDWDGDGKKDLIGCQFENTIRFYRNTGSRSAGAEPQFADPAGIVIVQGESPQMISGADAVDWNGDGQLDILTGQGHGGSGLRFYARNWIEDELHNTHPVVNLGRCEAKK